VIVNVINNGVQDFRFRGGFDWEGCPRSFCPYTDNYIKNRGGLDRGGF